jgi:hypothetical protein
MDNPHTFRADVKVSQATICLDGQLFATGHVGSELLQEEELSFYTKSLPLLDIPPHLSASLKIEGKPESIQLGKFYACPTGSHYQFVLPKTP